MQRRRYLVAYDISDERRLRSVYQEMLGWGTRLQYSVYLCDLTGPELTRMQRALRDLIDAKDDSVVIIDLGEAAVDRDCPIRTLGRPVSLPQGGPAVY